MEVSPVHLHHAICTLSKCTTGYAAAGNTQMEGEWLASCRRAAAALHLCPWRPELACALAGSASAASAHLAPAAARVGAASKPERPAVHGVSRRLYVCVTASKPQAHFGCEL